MGLVNNALRYYYYVARCNVIGLFIDEILAAAFGEEVYLIAVMIVNIAFYNIGSDCVFKLKIKVVGLKHLVIQHFFSSLLLHDSTLFVYISYYSVNVKKIKTKSRIVKNFVSFLDYFSIRKE